MRVKRGKDSRGGSLSESYTSVVRNTAQTCGVQLYGVFEGKSSTMLYKQFGELKDKYRNREFLCRGYYIDTTGKNSSRIAGYIRKQLEENRLGEQITISEIGLFTGSK